MKKLITMMLVLAMVISTMTLLAVPTSAEGVEGDWVTSRAADAYREGITDYIPAAGYKYTTEGFQTISPDFTNCNPYVQAHTKNAYDLKAINADGNGNALSVEFVVTDYAYNGGNGAVDQWIAITLNSEPVVAQGNPAYGSGLCILMRGSGNGSTLGQPHYVDKENNEFKPFTENGNRFEGTVNPTVDEESGKETYTFSIKHDGTQYVMDLCGTTFSDPDGNFDRIVDEYCTDGVYLGITLMTTIAETPASFVITEFQGEVPFGEDSEVPEANVNNFAELADSATVPAGQPAVKWDGNIEQCEEIKISHADYTVKDNGIVSLKCNSDSAYISFNLKNSISYQASDFPIIAVLTKDCWADSGKFYYMAGKTLGATGDCLQDFIIDEIELGEGWGLSILDLTDDPDWEGRINGLRCDFFGIDYADAEYNTFDVAYFGAFRSLEDAQKYAEDYLIALLGALPETEPPTTEEPTTEPAETDPADSESGDNSEEQTTGSDATTSCKSLVAIPAVALVAMLGAAFVAKKKD